jgi:hypothetical protein
LHSPSPEELLAISSYWCRSEVRADPAEIDGLLEVWCFMNRHGSIGPNIENVEWAMRSFIYFFGFSSMSRILSFKNAITKLSSFIYFVFGDFHQSALDILLGWL